jgi:hypothetical protein
MKCACTRETDMIDFERIFGELEKRDEMVAEYCMVTGGLCEASERLLKILAASGEMVCEFKTTMREVEGS